MVYADPSWVFDDKLNHGKRGTKHKYLEHPDKAIIDLPVQDLVADDAILFLWIVSPKLFDAKAVIDAWGFDFKTIGFVWAKTNPAKL